MSPILASEPEPDAPQASRNLIMFMPDQLRFDSLGCTGNPVIKTPNIDKLAAEGTLFTNCFAQASVCTQSRCSMFTGHYVHTTGHRSLDNMLKPWEGNMFRTLRDGGYHVCVISPRGDLFAQDATEMAVDEYSWIDQPANWPPPFVRKMQEAARTGKMPAPPTNPTAQQRLFYRGVLTEAESEDFDAGAIASTLQWLQSSPPEPFCLFIPLFYPHPPFQVKEPYFSMYREMDLPPRLPLSEKTGFEPGFMAAIRKEHGLDRATEEHWKDVKATYYGMINRLDDQLGDIVEILKDKSKGDLWNRTYTMVFTDHGEYLGDSDMIEKWPSGLHDVLVHDPLIVAGPNLPAGQVNDCLCEMVDITPTVLELLGVKEQYPHSGKSLVKTIKDNKPYHKEYAFSEGGFLIEESDQLESAAFPYDRKAALQHEQPSLVGRAISVRDQEWAYTYRLYEEPELFHRKSDPLEGHNLAHLPEHAETCNRLKNVIFEWLVRSTDYVPWTKDERKPHVDIVSTKEQMKRRQGAKGA